MNHINMVDRWFIHQNKVLRELETITGKQGISFFQYEVLVHFVNEEFSTISDLGEALEISKSSMSRALKILQSKKLIKKVYGTEEDQRRVVIVPTDEAKKAIEEIELEISKLNIADEL
ncbi:MarR family transcriptional regulator [Lactobacillus sp. YT155]|uniref:MarR family winged helix-turn-helix transcriptional regulator n=1 Tax=Lactobacillus sp. YT155 TaxID=3060955 RepID=UPI00266049BE|nr:MarR family transcriptional regulator [Lactobacillus sp. YT155]MDO1605891.1 MarR family transcriptional regulator [Lactobacillus sp. YT155]